MPFLASLILRKCAILTYEGYKFSDKYETITRQKQKDLKYEGEKRQKL